MDNFESFGAGVAAGGLNSIYAECLGERRDNRSVAEKETRQSNSVKNTRDCQTLHRAPVGVSEPYTRLRNNAVVITSEYQTRRGST
ncbi:hypothetical protein DPMN_001146 [Dreissena polymorpha]|uniref:Uncharacterized protein n=1 Tax=Dreissena polymorpha TaxID=45954 RepID=A0A9D4MIT7_DREPO|nr:hypothetical protein DPMN_001146 [Dreissena polymorpha]